MNLQTCLRGYLYKQADGPVSGMVTAAGTAAGGATELGRGAAGIIDQAAGIGIPLLMLAPVAAGAGAGMLASKMTSPTPLDREDAEAAIEAAETQQTVAQLRRRRALDILQRQKNAPDERSLHIG